MTMIDKTYSLSCLKGFSGVHEVIACPKKGSLSGKTIEWIEYFDLYSNLDMDGSIGFVCSRVLSVALPIIALLDFFIAPGKAVYFAATNQNKQAIKELKNAIHHLALAIFSTLSIPYAFYNPTSLYLSESTWTQIKQKHLKEELLVAFATLRESNLKSSDADLLAEAVKQTLPHVFQGENPEDQISNILTTISNQLEKKEDESVILLEHFQHWISVFLVACHHEKLQVDHVDDTFYHLICETICLKNPTLREEMTNRIIADFANGAPVIEKFQEYLKSTKEKRQNKIQVYLEEQKKIKQKEKTRLEDKIENLRKNLAKEQNPKALSGIKKSIEQLEKKLPLTGSIDEKFIEEKTERANQLFPQFSPTNHTYLSLYFALTNTDYSDELYQILHAPIFKDCHQRYFLLNFLLLIEKNQKYIDVNSLVDKMQEAYHVNSDRKSPSLVQFLKNCTILIQLKEWDKLKNDNPSLHSPVIIPDLFKSRFKLEQYEVENGDQKFLEDYERTFATFRDPTTIMMLYSTLSQLKKEVKKSAYAGLTEFVKHTLTNDEDLHQFRHSTEKSIHLEKCYKLDPELKEKWESTETFKPLSDDPRYKGYTIGEATAGKDLIMSSQEVIKSCLHPSGRPHKVKGFLAILMDGKIHPVVIKAPDGKIVARMLIKLLLPEDEKKTVMMIDTVYTSSHDADEIAFFSEKIMEYSKERADELNKCLVSFDSKDSSTGEDIGPVHSLPSGTPFEHVNAFEGPSIARKVVFENGEYSIPNAYLVD